MSFSKIYFESKISKKKNSKNFSKKIFLDSRKVRKMFRCQSSLKTIRSLSVSASRNRQIKEGYWIVHGRHQLKYWENDTKFRLKRDSNFTKIHEGALWISFKSKAESNF